MWSRNQRQTAARILFKRLGLLALLVLTAVAVSGVWGVYKKERESAVLRAEAERAQEDLLKREAQLQADIGRLNTDRGLEEALREQYALAEKGEKLIVIVDAPIPTPINATSTVLDWFRKTFRFW